MRWGEELEEGVGKEKRGEKGRERKRKEKEKKKTCSSIILTCGGTVSSLDLAVMISRTWSDDDCLPWTTTLVR